MTALPSPVERAAIAAAEAFNVPIMRLLSDNKERDVCEARFALCAVLVNDLGMTQHAAARALGRSDHTTVINALRKARELQADQRFAKGVEKIRLAAVGDKTTTADIAAWVRAWKRTGPALRWYVHRAACDAEAARDADDAIEEVSRALAKLGAIVEGLQYGR